jgi:hypothetical protein
MRNQFPKGWNEERVRELLAYYEEQTDEAAAAEAEEALANSTDTVMTVPHELVPIIRMLIAHHQQAVVVQRPSYPTILATILDGRIELLGKTPFHEGSQALVVLLPEQTSSAEISWDNDQAEIYAELLEMR